MSPNQKLIKHIFLSSSWHTHTVLLHSPRETLKILSGTLSFAFLGIHQFWFIIQEKFLEEERTHKLDICIINRIWTEERLTKLLILQARLYVSFVILRTFQRGVSESYESI